MTREEAIEEVKNYENYPNGLSKECRDYLIKALEKQDRIAQIIDDYDLLEAWEVLEMIKEVVRA